MTSQKKLLRDIPPHDTLVPFYNVFGGVHARRGEWLEALTNWNRSSNTRRKTTWAICISRRCCCN